MFDGFLGHDVVKMRYYGFLSSRGKQKLKSQQLKTGHLTVINTNKTEKINYKKIAKSLLGFDIDACPCCKTGRMITILQFSANAPPKEIIPTMN